MDREIIRQAYKGYLNNEAIEQKVEEYLNILKNNKLNKELNNTHLIIATEDKEQGLDFANNTAKFLCSQKIQYSYKQYDLSDRNIADISKVLENIIVVNNYDEYIKWEDIKEAISSTNKTIILCTTLSSENRYKEDERVFYNLFVKQIELKPYSIEDICSASKIFFEELKRNGKISSYDETFFSALDKYVRTVYPRAIRQGREFVEDLESRIIYRSYETNTPLELSEKTIPYYFKQESTDEILNNIKEYFCFSSDIDSILKNVSDCAKLKHARGFTEYKPTLNLNLSGYTFEYVEKFANIYARLLNSDKYNLIHAKNVTIMNLYDVMREKDNFNNKHGLILLKNFDLIKDFLNANEVVEQLIQIIKESKDLVWVLFGHHVFKEIMNINNEQSLLEIFNKEYSLDNHDKTSSEKYIRYCYANKQISNTPLRIPRKLDAKLCEDVLKSQNQKEATFIIEKEIINNTNIEDDFSVVKTKEAELEELVQNVKKHDSKERDEVNILLLAMSTINKVSVSEYTYKYENYDIKGEYVSSLEPVPKMLAEVLAKKNDKLDAIYVLNTKKTTENLSRKIQDEIGYYADTEEKYTAYSYFKERCSCLIESDKIYSIDLENNSEQGTNVEAALYELSQKLNDFLNEGKEINLYVDIHGGPRATQTIVDAILMLIKDIEHINLKDIYTGEFNGNNFPIVSVTSDFEIFNFVSGMKEFLSFGRSNELVEFNKTQENQNNLESIKIVDGINKISDSIVLNRMEKFGDNLKTLSNLVNTKDKEKGYYDTIKSLIRANYRVNINEHSYDLLNEDSINFPAQLQWCLDKNLLQQALMLIENRTSGVLEEANVLSKNHVEKENKDIKLSVLFGNWVIYSLAFEEENQWMKKNKGEYESSKTKIDNKKILCFEKMNQYNLFKDINILESKDIKEDIRGKRNNIESDYPDEYFECFEFSGKKEDREEKKIKDEYYIKSSSHEKKYAHLNKIPINDVLLKSQSFLESLYILLYVYKNLKWYRNTVAHPKKFNNSKDLKVEDLKAWIAFYIEMFMEVLNKAKEILGCEEPYQKDSNKKISMEEAMSNLNERYGLKYSK